MVKLTVDTDKCKGCGLCVDVCPNDVLSMSEDYNAGGYCFPLISEVNKCIGCQRCVKVCPDICFEIGIKK